MVRKLDEARQKLPPYPRTPHLCKVSNLGPDDICAGEEAEIIFQTDDVWIEEKVDGASVGICAGEHPLIRNRDHILDKGYIAKDTPAKRQFRPIWNWYYQNQEKFRKLEEWTGPVSVYGDWMLMQHGMYYDELVDYLIAYDLYNLECNWFWNPQVVREWLERAGFQIPPLLHRGRVSSFEQVRELLDRKSAFSSTGKVEGVYIKVGKIGISQITHRFKLVRPDFQQGGLFSETELKKNKLRR